MSSTSSRFTKPLVAAMFCPVGKSETFFWDTTLPGFGLRAYASGRRLWIAQYRDSAGRTRRASLGDVKTVDLDPARASAKLLLSQAALGADPAAEKRAARKAVRVTVLVEDYLSDAEKRMKPNSYSSVVRHLRTYAAPLHQETAGSVGRADIVKLLKAVTEKHGGVSANRLRSSLSALWAWALRTGAVDGENPVANVPKPGVEASRERVLTEAELALIWKGTAGDHDHDRIVRLLMLTGARREEVGGLIWTEINGPLWTLPASRSKNALPHEIPLGALALAHLPAARKERLLVFGEGEGGFSGWSRCKERLDTRIAALRVKAFTEAHGRAPEPEQLPAMAWTLHDLRRTVATWMSEDGTEPHIVEAVLNHVSGAAKRGVAGIYNRAAYREPKRAALARWETYVRNVAGLPALSAGNVVELVKAG